MIVSIPAVNGTYPVTAVGSPLNVACMVSVVKVPVAVSVWAEEHAALEIALVAKALAPLAMVCVIVAFAFGKVNVFALDAGPLTVKKPFAVPPLADGKMPVTFAVRSTTGLVITEK